MEKTKEKKTLATQLLHFYLLLSGEHHCTIPELESKLGVSERTIWNYRKAFEDNEFDFDHDYKFGHFISKYPYRFNEIENYYHITPQEKEAIIEGISGLSDQNPLKHSLLDRLMKDTKKTDKIRTKKNFGRNVEALKQAIDSKCLVVLEDYESCHSHTIRDRIVEPHHLCKEYYGVKAFDTESGEDKVFKISRIGNVRLLHESWQHEHRHRNYADDCFQMSGNQNEHIRLRMTLRAKDLVVEEFPEAAAGITGKEDCWYLETNILAMEGAARFILGLADEITIERGEKLRDFIIDKMDRHSEKYKKDKKIYGESI